MFSRLLEGLRWDRNPLRSPGTFNGRRLLFVDSGAGIGSRACASHSPRREADAVPEAAAGLLMALAVLFSII